MRTGPSGPMIISIRNKLLVIGPVDLADDERRFLLFAVHDSFDTSHSSIVKTQMGITMQMLRPTVCSQTNSEISDPGRQSSTGFSGTYQTQWDIMKSIMLKLGMGPSSTYQPLKTGPTGDPYGISQPDIHDIDDGTGYNHR